MEICEKLLRTYKIKYMLRQACNPHKDDYRIDQYYYHDEVRRLKYIFQIIF